MVMTVLQGAGETHKFRYRVAYQGVPGAYSEMAASRACPDAEPVPCEQFEVAFQVGRGNLIQTASTPFRL
jgi:arogenate/prephenate dehydratase